MLILSMCVYVVVHYLNLTYKDRKDSKKVVRGDIMGNWRTVNIKGKMNQDEAEKMIALMERYHGCLEFCYMMCSLHDWVKPDGTIDAIGNLSERDYDNNDIEVELQYFARLFPSLELTLHSGSDYESLICSATFHVKDGIVERCEPEVEMIEKISDKLLQDRLYKSLGVYI